MEIYFLHGCELWKLIPATSKFLKFCSKTLSSKLPKLLNKSDYRRPSAGDVSSA